MNPVWKCRSNYDVRPSKNVNVVTWKRRKDGCFIINLVSVLLIADGHLNCHNALIVMLFKQIIRLSWALSQSMTHRDKIIITTVIKWSLSSWWIVTMRYCYVFVYLSPYCFRIIQWGGTRNINKQSDELIMKRMSL